MMTDQNVVDPGTRMHRLVARPRQADEGRDSRHWLATLRRSRSKSVDAPSWLWRSVVDLVAAHEAAYLEHCRRYAMELDG
jgi:uncharacterized protein (DUF2252 family)